MKKKDLMKAALAGNDRLYGQGSLLMGPLVSPGQTLTSSLKPAKEAAMDKAEVEEALVSR